MVEAINDAFHVELARDENVMVMGEDVGRAGGVFRATAGLRDRFGPDRCFDMPEAGAVRPPGLRDNPPEPYSVPPRGVKGRVPPTPADAKGLLTAAIRDPD